MAEEWWRRAGLRRAGREPPRAPAFDLLERAPDRAAVLLGMVPSLVATVPNSPSATRVTDRSQCARLRLLPCRNDDIPGCDPASGLEQGVFVVYTASGRRRARRRHGVTDADVS